MGCGNRHGKLTDINLMDFSISSMDRVLGDVFDGALCEVAIRQEEGLQIALAGCDASTAQRPFRDQHVAETWVVLQSFSHLFFGDPHSF